MFQSNINNLASNRQTLSYGEDFYFNASGSKAATKNNNKYNTLEVPKVSQRYEEVSPLFLSTCEDCEIYGTEKNEPGSKAASQCNYTIEKNNNNLCNSIEVPKVSQHTDTQLKEDLLFLGCDTFISKYADSFTYYDNNARYNEDGYCINNGEIYTIKRIKEKQYNLTTGKNEYVPCVISGDIRFKVMYNFILARRVMKRDVTFGCLLFNAVKDSVTYLDNSDNLITPLTILNRVEQVMNLTEEELNNSHINPDSRRIITDPSKENRRTNAQKGRRAVILSQRKQIYNPTISDRENAKLMGVDEKTVRRYRKTANLTSPRQNRQSEREINILTYYNPTESINANFKRMKSMGLDIALSSLKRYVKSHRDELFNAGNLTKPHHTFNNAKPIQITTDIKKDDQRANMKAVTDNNTISPLERTEEERSNFGFSAPAPARTYTEEEQRLMDDLNKRYMDYYNAQNAEDDVEPTEEEKDDCGASGEVWDYELSETWGVILDEGLKYDYKELFRGLLIAISQEEWDEFSNLYEEAINEMNEYADYEEERSFERILNVLLNEMEDLGYSVKNERENLTYRYQYAV